MQEFELKMQRRGLMREGGRNNLWDSTVLIGTVSNFSNHFLNF